MTARAERAISRDPFWVRASVDVTLRTRLALPVRAIYADSLRGAECNRGPDGSATQQGFPRTMSPLASSSDAPRVAKDQVDPVRHLLGIATGRGLNPERDANYLTVMPSKERSHDNP